MGHHVALLGALETVWLPAAPENGHFASLDMVSCLSGLVNYDAAKYRNPHSINPINYKYRTDSHPLLWLGAHGQAQAAARSSNPSATRPQCAAPSQAAACEYVPSSQSGSPHHRNCCSGPMGSSNRLALTLKPHSSALIMGDTLRTLAVSPAMIWKWPLQHRPGSPCRWQGSSMLQRIFPCRWQTQRQCLGRGLRSFPTQAGQPDCTGDGFLRRAVVAHHAAADSQSVRSGVE